MLSILTWLWRTPNYHTLYTAAHVNRLAMMVARHYPAPHRFCCATNDPAGIDPGITIIPDRCDFANIPSPHGGNNPACFRRLRLFHPDAAQWFGERFVSLDLDCVITGDLRPLWDRTEDFVGWQDACHPRQMCGSMLLMTAGSRPHVWTGFNPARSPSIAKAAGFAGSDQAWISYCLPGEAQWTRDDGVYNFRFDLGSGTKPLPENARVVFFTGKGKPWDEGMPEWVREHYG